MTVKDADGCVRRTLAISIAGSVTFSVKKSTNTIEPTLKSQIFGHVEKTEITNLARISWLWSGSDTSAHPSFVLLNSTLRQLGVNQLDHQPGIKLRLAFPKSPDRAKPFPSEIPKGSIDFKSSRQFRVRLFAGSDFLPSRQESNRGVAHVAHHEHVSWSQGQRRKI